jgi:hypothetical protein
VSGPPSRGKWTCGKPVTVQFDLDTLDEPLILQKGYLSSLEFVSSVAT